jgi:hypothetical protein
MRADKYGCVGKKKKVTSRVRTQTSSKLQTHDITATLPCPVRDLGFLSL